MLKKLLSILCFALLVTLAGHSQAQSDDPAALLIIRSQGVFWSWSEDNGLHQQTVEGYPYNVDRSADGRYLVYATHDKVVFEAMERNEAYNGEVYPTNLWVYDLLTGAAAEIASQPAEMVYNPEAVVGYDRFNPQWSPDGSKIAWIELPLGLPDEEGWRLVILDVAQNSTQVVNGLRGPSGLGDGALMGTIGLRWETIGLITETIFYTSRDSFTQLFMVYDATGSVIATHELSNGSISGWFWSDDEAVIFGSGRNAENEPVGVLRLDIFTATEEIMPAALIVPVSRSAPDQLAYYLVDNDEEHVAHVWMLGDDAPTVYEITSERYLSSQLAISPDGKRIAYITDALYIWEDGATRRIPDSEQFATGQPPANLIWGEPTQVLMNQEDVPFGVE